MGQLLECLEWGLEVVTQLLSLIRTIKPAYTLARHHHLACILGNNWGPMERIGLSHTVEVRI